MSSYPTGLVFRTWKVLQSGELKDVSPQLTARADKPLLEFFLEMITSPAIQELSTAGVAIADDEFLIYVSSEEGGPLDCMVTSRKLIFLNTGPTRTCLFSSITGVNTMKSNYGNPARVEIKRKRGHPLDMNFASESSTAAIQFAAEKYDRQWQPLLDILDDELKELDTALQSPELAAQADEAAGVVGQDGPAEASVKSFTRKSSSEGGFTSAPKAARQEETWGSIFAEMIPMFVGFGAFVIFLMANGAPIFHGGPAVIQWLSQDNMGYFYGAVVAGFLAAFFWPKKK